MKSDLTTRAKNGYPHPTHSEADANFERLSYWSGTWQPDPVTYSQYEEVYHDGAIWVCRAGVASTVEQPSLSGTDWQLKLPSSGRGGATIDAPKLTLGPIGSGWQAIDEFDTVDLPVLGLSINAATGEFSFSFPGIWQITISLIFSHNESNQGRTTNIRLWNVTKSSVLGSLPWFIGRNQPGSNIIIPFPVLVAEAAIGNSIRFEIGGGSSITPVSVDDQAIDFFQFGPSAALP